MGYNVAMIKKYESFKINKGLLAVIRKYAKADNRSIKTLIEIVLRERFTKKTKPAYRVEYNFPHIVACRDIETSQPPPHPPRVSADVPRRARLL